MNTYAKYCPNVFVAKCTESHEKDETITLETKRGNEHECIVHNLVAQKDGFYYYSITRADGFNSQQRAQNRADRLAGWKSAAEKRSEQWMGKSQEGRDFLSLGEPIKIGHHSEKRHRALIERNWNRTEKAMDELKKSESYESRIAYWEELSGKIDLSMPESLEFFQEQLKTAEEYHAGLKNGTIEREHGYSLVYAKKSVKEIQKKLEIAKKLWG